MFPRIGPMEILLLAGIVLLLVGPRRLPEVGRSIGQMLREFRKSNKDLQQEVLGEDASAADERNTA